MDGIFSGKSNLKLLRPLILLLFLIACGLPELGTTSTPPSSQFASHILVSLTDPQDGDTYPISAGLSVRAEAISDGSIARMELWVDGSLYETYTAPEDGLGLLVHYWAWSPQTIGAHTLMVRAYNDQDQTAFSNVIHIKGIEDPGYVLIVRAEDGDSVASIAERYNVSTDEVIQENPELEPTASLLAGDEVFVHIGAPVPASAPSTTARVLMKLNEWSVNKALGDFIPQAALSAPSLNVSGQGCKATLTIGDSSDNEKGFNIYRLNPGALSFSKLTSLPVHGGVEVLAHQDSNLYGLYHYYVAAFDDLGETASNLVSIHITDASCAGIPTTINDLGFLTMGVEDFYLYIAINNGNWRRFPADEFTYLKKSQGIDLGQVVTALVPNPVGNISMRGEVWGMVNGTATLLGSFEKSFKTGQAPAMIEPSSFYQSLTTKLEVRGVYDVSKAGYPWLVEKGTGYTAETFRFGTDADAAYGMWQVSSVPFQSEVSFNPACLLLAGKANGSGTPSSPFEFNIDFSQLKPKIEAVQLSPFENSLSQTPVFSQPFSPEKMDTQGQQAVTKPKWGVDTLGLGGTPIFANFDPCAQNVSTEGVVTYYVRIIPMNNGQSAGVPSNTVKMSYDPNSQIKITFTAPPPIPQGTYYEVKILNFTGVHEPEGKYVFCVVVVENKMPQGSPWAGFPPGTILCPKTFKGGNDDDLLGAIEDAFNFISGLYNKLSDWATELVEQLNPLCIQAKLASKAIKVGEEEVKDACHYIAVIAVTAAKTYVGLPPSLPNFDQLTELGKENLVELAAQELENSGVPCPEECKDVIRKGIDYSLEQVKNSMTNSSCIDETEAHENGIEPLCLPSGMSTKPDPRGQAAPAVLEVQVKRLPGTTGPDFPEPTSCKVTVNAYAKNNVITSYTSDAGFHWTGGAIEGKLFSGGASFPNLQPDDSTKLPIVLSPESYWLAGHQQFVKQGWEPEHYDDWHILYQGATATINAGGLCKFELPGGTGFGTDSVAGDSLQAGPLGGAWKQTCHPYNCP